MDSIELIIRLIILIKYVILEARKSDFRATNWLSRALSKEWLAILFYYPFEFQNEWNIQMHLIHKFYEEKHLSFLLLSNVVHTNVTLEDYEIKKETEFEDTKTDTEEGLEDAGEG